MKSQINPEECFIGIELGSTRIKGVMIDNHNNVVATGGHDWSNSLIDGIWTYDLKEITDGLQNCYSALKADFKNKYGLTISKVKGLGISAMMHGMIALDFEGNLLTPFRTWRNNITEEESVYLSKLFDFPIPQRWTISHLYKSLRDKCDWLKKVDYVTPLSGYVHKLLTNERVIGIGDASGIFPIDVQKKNYDSKMVEKFDEIIKNNGYQWTLNDVFPKVLVSGKKAGYLTNSGALLLDPTGDLQEGIPFCPPEGDAGTGMIATNSVRVNSGNVSAGTSVFAMVVLDKPLKKTSDKLDLVTTPDGNLVAMVHSNNCTSEYDSWIKLFKEVIDTLGLSISIPDLYDGVLKSAIQKDIDCSGIVSYPYVSGEHVTGFSEGRPMVIKNPKTSFSLGSFMRSQLFASVSAIRVGLDVLFEEEGVKLDRLVGHGGFFKTAEVGGRIMASATNTPISIRKNAGEGGAFGIAVLASYMFCDNKTLPDYLDTEVFEGEDSILIKPLKEEVDSFNTFYKNYVSCLDVEKKAVEVFS